MTSLNSIERTFEIIRVLQELDGARIAEIEHETGIPTSTIYRYLTNLRDKGYVTKEGDLYLVGLKFLNHGQYARTRKEAYLLARDKVAEIAEQTDERAQFVVEENFCGYVAYRSLGSNAVQAGTTVGTKLQLHSTAAGKAILASLPTYRQRRFFEDNLEGVTGATLTEPTELRDELAEIAERGYSFNRAENIEGVRAVGVSIMAEDDVIGAISLSGPSNRFEGQYFEETLPELLLGMANELEVNIAFL